MVGSLIGYSVVIVALGVGTSLMVDSLIGYSIVVDSIGMGSLFSKVD